MENAADHNNALTSQLLNCSQNGNKTLNEEQLLSRFDDDRYEIFFMKIPKTLDPEYFKGEKVSLTGKTKIKVNNEVYLFQPSGADSQSIWVYNNGLKKFGSVQHITVEKSVKSQKYQPQGEPQVDTPLCVNVVSRNPFFGAQYQRDIKLDSIIKQELDNADAKLKKQDMKKVQKRYLKKNNANELAIRKENECQEEIFKLLGSHHFDISKRNGLGNSNKQCSEKALNQYTFMESTNCDVRSSKKRKRSKSLIEDGT